VRALDGVYLPPARQGDVYRAVREHRPTVIGLIDGAFLDVPSVWHRELLWAMTAGVHLFGAASMGALRAAELAPFGMRGIGVVYEAYRSGTWRGFDEAFEDDDEVAVIHAPQAAGGVPLSDAMVDLRETLLLSEAAGIIDRAGRNALASAMKRLHFPDRSFATLTAIAYDLLDPGTAAGFADWLPANRVGRKRLDAIELLQTVADFVRRSPPPFVPAFRFEEVQVWDRFVAVERPLHERSSWVLDELRLDRVAWHRAAKAALGRSRALAGRARSQEATADELDQFRRARGLWLRSDLDAWLEGHDLNGDDFARLIQEEALLGNAAAQVADHLAPCMVDGLRLSGDYRRLLQRAETKRRTDPKPPSGPDMDVALEWYFARQSLPMPASIGTWAIAAGWADEVVFTRAIWGEYLLERNKC
jgi:hypothetical protein